MSLRRHGLWPGRHGAGLTPLHPRSRSSFFYFGIYFSVTRNVTDTPVSTGFDGDAVVKPPSSPSSNIRINWKLEMGECGAPKKSQKGEQKRKRGRGRWGWRWRDPVMPGGGDGGERNQVSLSSRNNGYPSGSPAPSD